MDLPFVCPGHCENKKPQEEILQFKPSDNLIDLLVGENLYSSPDAAMRELLQNAEDACQLQSIDDASYEPEIVVRFSVSGNWAEISDNGLGMAPDVFQESFATVGASKTNSPRLKDLMAKAGPGIRPIGQFGIGILSCFGVADIVEVRTRAREGPPVSYRIRSLRELFEELSDHRDSRGTSIRLALKPGGPMQPQQIQDSLNRYVRHAHHIWVENVDTGERHVVREQWLLNNWEPSAALSLKTSESGFLQLSEAWENINHGLDDQFMVCNAGFHVTTLGAGTLAETAIGIRGEVSLRPGSLTIHMNRESFQHDGRWSAIVGELIVHYRARVAEKLESWVSANFENVSYESRRAMQRMVLLILRSPLGQAVGNDNMDRARKLVTHVLLLSNGRNENLNNLIEKARARPPLYVFRNDDQQQIQRSFSDRGQTVSLTENVGSLELRMTLLQLNGFAVARTERHDYAVQIAKGNRTIQIHDFDMIVDVCGPLGIDVKKVQDAPANDTTIGSSPDAEAIIRLFQMPTDLKIQSVENMTNAIIADFNGYILNLGNDEIKRILSIVPDAVGNPIRKDLLSAYLALSTYNVSLARNTIFELMIDPDFESKAGRTTGRFFRNYLEERVKALLKSKGANDA